MPDSPTTPEQFMRRAISLGAKGRGRVESNPMVGCVLVRDGKIIGEGYHERFGGPHAEVNALAKCADASGATAYVMLEPCAAFAGKKTPACSSALVAAKIAKVVAACEDPNPGVSGAGFAALRSAGIDIEVGCSQQEAQQLNAAFFKSMKFKRPYVTLKWAQTADSKIAGPGGKRLRISNAASLAAMHRLRSMSDAILVGINTVLYDDPMLAARVDDPPRRPRRVVLDSNLRIGMQTQLVKTARELPVEVYCTKKALETRRHHLIELRVAGVEVIPVSSEESGWIALDDVLRSLHERGVMHLFVEPGPTLARSFLGQNLADRVWVTKSPMRVDSVDAPEAAVVDYPVSARLKFEGDVLTEFLNFKSPVFYSVERSADLELISPERSHLELEPPP
jgi:diaminohydroxyphosphoribosylaminopyrimidine deaminase/5-amino-6-(5-phosphoribosylamino)uracil reductase